MAPKDIRSFFGGVPAKKSDAKPSGGDAVKRPAAQQSKPSPAKKQKTNESSAAPSAKRPALSPVAQPTAGKGKGAASSGAKATPKSAADGTKAAAKQKKKTVVDSDSDSDFKVAEDEAVDMITSSDEEELPAQPTKRRAVVVSSDDEDAIEDEVMPTPKQRKDAAPALGQGRAMPASLLTPTAKKPKAAAKSPAGKASTPKAKAPAKSRMSAADQALANLSPDAKKAVAAVAAAIGKLPSEQELKDSGRMTVRADTGGWGGGGGDDTPPENAGKKEAPSGHPDCLTNLVFVITGVLDSLWRHEAKDYVQRHGGRVTGGVSGKTSFLLCGQNTGTSKLRAAHDKGTKLIDEDGLFSLVKASQPFAPTSSAAPVPAVSPAKAPGAAATSAAGRSTGGASTSKPVPARVPAQPADPGSQLWVDKWKPQSVKDLVGNPGPQGLIRQFLGDWHRVHIQGEAPKPAPGGATMGKKDMSRKALLISGVPGTGKTSASHIIAKELGFDVVEVNASDTRSKADGHNKMKQGIAGKLSNRVKELVTNTAIGAGDGNTTTRKQVLVMDEVDGMSGGDRGGVSDLILSIKASRMPIICICNDKYKTSLRSLKNYCIELDWRKPTKAQVQGRLMAIARAEGLSLNPITMDALVESAQGDIRVMLGQLQMHRLQATSLSYDDVRAASSKDMDKSPFECARKLLSTESAALSMNDRMDCVFQDMDLVPLLVQENYLNHRPSLAHNEMTQMSVIAKAADAFSAGDVMNRRVRMNQEWTLAPAAVVMTAVYPASYMRGSRDIFNPGEMNFPRFTAWLGANSSATKQRRVATELATKLMASGAVVERRDLRLQYLPLLRLALTQPLATQGADGIDTVIALMQNYLISRDDLEAIVDITKFKTTASWGQDPMKLIETKVKSAFTRSFNKQGLPIKCTVMVEDGKKGKKVVKKAAPADDDEDRMSGELAEAAAVNAADDDSDVEEVDPTKLGVAFTAAMGKKGKGAAKSAGGAGRGTKGASASGRGRGRGAASTGRGAKRGRGK